MSSSGLGKTPFARFVLFIICLSAAGAFVAGVYWYAVDLPQQKAVQAPENAGKVWCGSYLYQCNGERFNQCHADCMTSAHREVYGGEEAIIYFEQCVEKRRC